MAGRSGRLIASTIPLILIACATREKPVVVPDMVFQRALETQLSGQSMPWQLAGGGDLGTIEPLRTFRTEEGRFCREYEVAHQANDGRNRRWVDIACRFQDGDWRQVMPNTNDE